MEESLGLCLVAGIQSADVDLLPLNWHIVGLEYCLDGLRDFSTDTVTCLMVEWRSAKIAIGHGSAKFRTLPVSIGGFA